MTDKTHTSTAILQDGRSVSAARQTSFHICYGYARTRVAIRITVLARSALQKMLILGPAGSLRQRSLRSRRSSRNQSRRLFRRVHLQHGHNPWRKSRLVRRFLPLNKHSSHNNDQAQCHLQRLSISKTTDVATSCIAREKWYGSVEFKRGV